MKTPLRTLLAVVAGLALALAFVVAVEAFSEMVYPTPPDFTGTMEEMCLHVSRYPDWVLGVVVLLWSATAFLSAWIATRIGNRPAGVVLSLVLAAAISSNIAMLPYTMWFKVVMLICFTIACYFGVANGSRFSPRAADLKTGNL